MDIELKNLYKAFDGKTVLQDFSTVLPEGEITCIMGPSGCGKTTLLRILLGLTKADAGTIEGVPKAVSAVFQEDRLCGDFTARANVKLVTGRSVTDAEIDTLLTQLGLGDAREKPVRDYSGGMRRRAALARALLAQGDLLVLDEPFKGLDEETRRDVMGLLLERVRGKTVIAVTHDPEEAAMLGGRLIRMTGAGI